MDERLKKVIDESQNIVFFWRRRSLNRKQHS